METDPLYDLHISRRGMAGGDTDDPFAYRHTTTAWQAYGCAGQSPLLKARLHAPDSCASVREDGEEVGADVDVEEAGFEEVGGFAHADLEQLPGGARFVVIYELCDPQ